MPLLSLPYDVLDFILPLVPPLSLHSFSLASKACHALVQEDSLWRNVYLSSFDALPSDVLPDSFDWRGEVQSRWRAAEDVRLFGELLDEVGEITPRSVRVLKHRDELAKWEAVMERLTAEKGLQSWVSTFATMSPLALDASSASSDLTLEYLAEVLEPTMASFFAQLASQAVLLNHRRIPPSPRTSTRPSRSPSATRIAEASSSTADYSHTHLPLLSHLLALLPPPPSALPTSYRSLCRSLVYSFQSHGRRTAFGPFLPRADFPDAELAEGWRVDWRMVRSIYHVVGENIKEWEEGRGEMIDEEDEGEEAFRMMRVPRGMGDVRGLTWDKLVEEEWDWAGVEGRWTRVVSFMDYVDLFAFNFLPAQFRAIAGSSGSATTSSAAFFHEYVEATRILHMQLTLHHYEHRPPSASPSAPRPPVIHFTGIVVDSKGDQVLHHQGGSELTGSAEMMDEGGVRWRFISHRLSTPLWSSEAVQPFGARSNRGLFGLWTGVHHDEQDPIGPFWMWKNEAQPQAE